MDNLIKRTVKNPGGMLRFYYMQVEDTPAIASPGLDKIIDDPIILPVDALTYYGYVTQGRAAYKEDCVQDANGVKYKISFKGFIPEMAPDRSVTIERLNQQRWIVIAVSNTLRKVVMGTLENPCRCVADYDSGKSFGDINGHEATFYWESPTKAPFYEAELEVIGPGGGS